MDWNEFSQRLNDKMDKTFKPTVEWMTAKYTEMNDELFGGELMVVLPSLLLVVVLKVVLLVGLR